MGIEDDLFSEVERNLFEETEEEIRARKKVYCFDVKGFDLRISSGDPWQRIVLGHLYFEHVVGQTLLEALIRPEAISLSRMGYSQRIELAFAMGILEEDLVLALRKLNSLRNRLAHDLTFQISDQDVLDFSNCTQPEIKSAIRTAKGGSELTLYDLLRGNMILLESQRQKNAVVRELRARSELKLRYALEEYRRTIEENQDGKQQLPK